MNSQILSQLNLVTDLMGLSVAAKVQRGALGLTQGFVKSIQVNEFHWPVGHAAFALQPHK